MQGKKIVTRAGKDRVRQLLPLGSEVGRGLELEGRGGKGSLEQKTSLVYFLLQALIPQSADQEVWVAPSKNLNLWEWCPSQILRSC